MRNPKAEIFASQINVGNIDAEQWKIIDEDNLYSGVIKELSKYGRYRYDPGPEWHAERIAYSLMKAPKEILEKFIATCEKQDLQEAIDLLYDYPAWFEPNNKLLIKYANGKRISMLVSEINYANQSIYKEFLSKMDDNEIKNLFNGLDENLIIAGYKNLMCKINDAAFKNVLAFLKWRVKKSLYEKIEAEYILFSIGQG